MYGYQQDIVKEWIRGELDVVDTRIWGRSWKNAFLYSIGGSEKGVIDDLNDRFEDFSEIYAYTNKKRK
jgi:hypothetical protein